MPSWVKSKTPVSKSRLSGAGVLGRFGPGKSPTTGVTQSTVSPVRSVSGIDKSTWDGEMFRGGESDGGVRDETMSLSMQIKDRGGLMGDVNDLDMGLDLQRGVKRPRASVCLCSAKSRPNGLDSVGLTGTPPSQNTTSGFDLTTGGVKLENKRVRREGVSDSDEGSGRDEDFLSWGDGGARSLGVGGESFSRVRGEEDDAKDLDLGF